MQSDNEKTLVVEIQKTSSLGIKVVLAKDSSKIYAVITDVNPEGILYKENVEAGDLLAEINSEIISTKASLYKISDIPVGQMLKFVFIKKGAFKVEGLFKKCFYPQCSEFCEYYIPIKIERLAATSTPKTYQTQTLPRPVVKYSRKLSTDRTDVNVTSSSVQTALPMKKNRFNSQNATSKTLKVKYKDNRITNHVIAPPQPQFIRRNNHESNTLQKSNSSLAKSLNNLTDIKSDGQSLSTNSSHSINVDSYPGRSYDLVTITQPPLSQVHQPPSLPPRIKPRTTRPIHQPDSVQRPHHNSIDFDALKSNSTRPTIPMKPNLNNSNYKRLSRSIDLVIENTDANNTNSNNTNRFTFV